MHNEALGIVADWIGFPFFDEETRRRYLSIDEDSKKSDDDSDIENDDQEQQQQRLLNAKRARTDLNSKRQSKKSNKKVR